MKKKDKTPALLKFVRWAYPRVEKIAPGLAHRYFVRLFFQPVRYPLPEKEKKAESFAQPFSFEAAHKRIQAYAWGPANSPYVLLVHGWSGRATQFRRFVKPLLAKGYCVIGFDGPAHGRSQGSKTHIVEFEETLQKIVALKGVPDTVIAHSFGGGAVLMAAMHGLPIKKLINISSPTIGDEIINTYLRAIQGSPATGTFFKEYVLRAYGKPFDEFTALHFIRHLPTPLSLMLVHDANDREVSLAHAEALIREYPSAKLLRTEGLGHTRILKDNEVIHACETFITTPSSH
ncbi:alpha/beta hydrolase [Parachryseolinea silvisoli]|uniref:alpha/beta hydrolase n=1 Tax=Parachryseolinea silvisoli TaxID=2873601 RepID=UPI002265F737|nr:alpha/beta hydrolase [Parachryseolinea silvisoli]MCD9015337.1 alpha/beta hydrolase [Parachryseolinea silvisoli]